MAYSPEEREDIITYALTQLATGRFLSRVFREDQTTANGTKLPAASTFWEWVYADDSGSISEKVGRAREAGIEALLDETTEIADDGFNDWVEREREDGSKETVLDREHLQRSKLRIETRIKLAQMMKPKTYGPKLDLTSGGEKLGMGEALERAQRRTDELRSNYQQGEK